MATTTIVPENRKLAEQKKDKAKRPGKKGYGEDVKSKAMTLWDSGKKPEEIADSLGIGKNAVKRWAIKAGKLVKKPRKKKEEASA